jgi:hypothetical protein
MECGGSGFSHCCDGPPEQPADPPAYKIGDIVPSQFRNCGGSYGLEYPYIFANVAGQYIIWHRHSGEVVYIETSKFPALHQYRCAEECQRRNGLRPNTVSAEVLAEIDAQE